MRIRRLKKFIPASDSDFALTAQQFAGVIQSDSARFKLSSEDVQSITGAVAAFRQALALTTRPDSRNKISIMTKDEAREKCVQVVQKYANMFRGNPDISRIDKMLLRIKERPTRLKRQACPKLPPHLEYIEPRKAGDGWPLHVLRFREHKDARRDAKPNGAVRLELFVELVPPDAPIPKRPGRYSWGWPMYLRSFTRSPMEVAFPMPPEPRRIVYFGRWSDSIGEVGPWSNALVTTLEGCADPRALGYRESPQRVVISVLAPGPRMLEQVMARDDRALPAPQAA